jgi:hypothetical protein
MLWAQGGLSCRGEARGAPTGVGCARHPILVAATCLRPDAHVLLCAVVVVVAVQLTVAAVAVAVAAAGAFCEEGSGRRTGGCEARGRRTPGATGAAAVVLFWRPF